ncbi:hypothetical protein EMCRGX_G025519 [Ephydatia muelleri]|eukprot:Em0021g345a
MASTGQIGFEAIGSDEQSLQPSAHVDMSKGTYHSIEDTATVGNDGSQLILTLEERRAKESTVCFEDGVRTIDFVLCYKKLPNETEEDTDGTDKLNSIEDGKKKEQLKKRYWFLKQCEKNGLQLEKQHWKDSPDKETYYIKIHAEHDFLLRRAEDLSYRMPIGENTLTTHTYREQLFDRLHIRDPFLPHIPHDLEIDEYLTAPFKYDLKDHFLNANDPKFFTSALRSALTWHILQNTPYTENGEDISSIGIGRLLSAGVFSAAYPLHESNYSVRKGEDIKTDRQFLFERWAHPRNIFKHQPLDHVRRYFGEKVGIYFTWTGFYTYFLHFAAFVGVIVMCVGLSKIPQSRNPIAREICQTNRTTFYMCPLCDEKCDFWYLKESCPFSYAAYLFDNEATVFFAGFMALWAVLFLEFWKRRQFQLQHDWDVLGYEEAEEQPRPAFEQRIKHYISLNPKNAKNYVLYNPVLERDEYIQPPHLLLPKLMLSFSILCFMVLLVIGVVFSLILYRVAVAGLLYVTVSQIPGGPSIGDLFVSITGAILQLICVLVLNRVYEFLAYKLTDWELHRTQTQYDDSFTVKLYIFQFVNFYSSIFYIAFFKGNFAGYPGGYFKLGRARLEECSTYGCLLELTIQYGIIMIGKQALNNGVELGIPLVKQLINWWKKQRKEEEEEIYTRWERDNILLPVEEQGLFSEYLELVIQYGFVTIFVAAFPLAPLFALLNNWIEIRLDAYKFCTLLRRPVAERAQDIGSWYAILDVVSKLSVVTNAWLIAVTANFIPLEVYKHLGYADAVASSNSTLGYVNWTQSSFDLSVLIESGSFPLMNAMKLKLYDQSDNVIKSGDSALYYLPFVNYTCMAQNGCFNAIQNIAFNETGWASMLKNTNCSSLLFNLENPSDPAVSVITGFGACAITDVTCRFRSQVSPGGSRPLSFYQTMVGRLGFVIVFEHVIFFLSMVIAWAVPDVPENVENEIKREKLLAYRAQQQQVLGVKKDENKSLHEEHPL